MSCRRRASRASLLLSIAVAATSAVFLQYRATVYAQAPAQESLSVYSPQTTYSVPVLQINDQPYVGVIELLEPLGSVEGRPDGKKYKLRFTAPGGRPEEMQFENGKDKVKLKKQQLKLVSLFVIQNGRGYLPLTAISELLARLTGQDIQLHPVSRRLFVGNVPERFTIGLHNDANSRLFISFPAPVNPSIATEAGHVRFTFKREPVVSSGVDIVKFNDPLITGATFSEHDGMAELDVLGTAPMMANFADGGKTIIVTAAPAPPPAVAQQQAPQPSVPAAQEAPAAQPRPPAAPRFLVLIDPAHGGSETGAAITPSLAEKDVVLALARRVQRELNSRGVAAGLLRNSDVAITLDQRAVSANGARPALYVSLHAANTGRGVHVFTSLLPATAASAKDFLPWDSAQAAFLDLSGSVAGSVAAELEARKLPNSTLVAPLRPMNNIAAPAIAVEIAPPEEKVDEIASPAYQEKVAQSIAAGIAAVRGKLPAVRP